MNILVIADNFSKGGLETHIDTYYNYLSKDNTIMFAFGNYGKGSYLNGAKIFCDNFHFSANCTIADFQKDVELLVKIIEDNKIDLIHVHPFYCLFPAMVAANITCTKIVFTVHGRASLNFFNNVNDTILYKFAIEELLNAVFCVSRLGEEWLSKYNKDRIYFLPNLVDCNRFYEHEVIANKKWALISRLDVDKSKEIVILLDMLDDLDIESIDIYGSGANEKALKEYVDSHKLGNKVFFKGYSDKIDKILDKKYNGVIGQGRVVLEAMAMNYPVINIGLCKIGGVVDDKRYSIISGLNFVPTVLKSVTIKELNKQLRDLKNLKSFQFRNRIMKDFSTKKLDDYCKIVKKISFYENSVLSAWYNSVKKIKDKKQLFYVCYDIFNLLNSYIVSYCSDVELKSFVNAFAKINELNQITYNSNQELLNANSEIKRLNKDLTVAKNKIDSLNDEIQTLKSTILSLEKRVVVTENTGLTTLVKRAAKNVVKRK